LITLVTGAGGFVGGHLLSYLRQSFPQSTLHGTLLSEAERRPKLEEIGTFHVIDLRDEAATFDLLKTLRPDRIFHLAGQPFVPRSFEAPWETLEINIRCTLNLLQAMREFKLQTRLLVIGSADVYGAVRSEDLPLTEESLLAPTSPYGVSKCGQDLLALQYAKAHGLYVIRTRPFNHIGPGQSPRFAVPDWASQIAQIEAGRRAPVVEVGNLDASRDFTDVRDVVRAYSLALENGTPGEVYNVCSGKAYAMHWILDTLVSLSNTQITVQVNPDRVRPIEIPMLYGDNQHLCRQTGWEPHIPITQSLQDVLNEARQNLK